MGVSTCIIGTVVVHGHGRICDAKELELLGDAIKLICCTKFVHKQKEKYQSVNTKSVKRLASRVLNNLTMIDVSKYIMDCKKIELKQKPLKVL
mgnify:CR=1 FL=1